VGKSPTLQLKYPMPPGLQVKVLPSHTERFGLAKTQRKSNRPPRTISNRSSLIQDSSGILQRKRLNLGINMTRSIDQRRNIYRNELPALSHFQCTANHAMYVENRF
jgi:hypothetical protein